MLDLSRLKQEDRTRCEVWTRVMGYHRPVSAFNPGKQSEHRDRVFFREPREMAYLDGNLVIPPPFTNENGELVEWIPLDEA